MTKLLPVIVLAMTSALAVSGSIPIALAACALQLAVGRLVLLPSLAAAYHIPTGPGRDCHSAGCGANWKIERTPMCRCGTMSRRTATASLASRRTALRSRASYSAMAHVHGHHSTAGGCGCSAAALRISSACLRLITAPDSNQYLSRRVISCSSTRTCTAPPGVADLRRHASLRDRTAPPRISSRPSRGVVAWRDTVHHKGSAPPQLRKSRPQHQGNATLVPPTLTVHAVFDARSRE